jgi:hypothetical protein
MLANPCPLSFPMTVIIRWRGRASSTGAFPSLLTFRFVPDKTDLISERLAHLSKERGSADNISVIVVFLREPSKIAAEAHWANRNASPITMDTSLDNANNPFANSNGADNNIIAQKTDGLLLNLSDNFKHNGSDLSPAGDFYHNTEKSNGKRLASEFDDDDDLGPETDVDAVDDVLSPSIVAAKALADGIVNNNPDGSFNPFVEKHEVEKAALEIDFDLQKQQSSEFDGQRSPREETPTPPADASKYLLRFCLNINPWNT